MKNKVISWHHNKCSLSQCWSSRISNVLVTALDWMYKAPTCSTGEVAVKEAINDNKHYISNISAWHICSLNVIMTQGYVSRTMTLNCPRRSQWRLSSTVGRDKCNLFLYVAKLHRSQPASGDTVVLVEMTLLSPSNQSLWTCHSTDWASLLASHSSNAQTPQMLNNTCN